MACFPSAPWAVAAAAAGQSPTLSCVLSSGHTFSCTLKPAVPTGRSGETLCSDQADPLWGPGAPFLFYPSYHITNSTHVCVLLSVSSKASSLEVTCTSLSKWGSLYSDLLSEQFFQSMQLNTLGFTHLLTYVLLQLVKCYGIVTFSKQFSQDK